MTNKEKAKQITEESKEYFYHDEYECGLACALRMAKWKDQQFEEEKKELRGLVKMLPVNETNQTIIEDLTALLS